MMPLGRVLIEREDSKGLMNQWVLVVEWAHGEGSSPKTEWRCSMLSLDS